MEPFYLALMLTSLAAVATVLGCVALLFCRVNNTAVLAFSLAFAGGAMTYISLFEVLPHAVDVLREQLGDRRGYYMAVAVFFGSMLLVKLLDDVLPSETHTHSNLSPEHVTQTQVEEQSPELPYRARLNKMALLTALGIAIHNIPEGLAAFLAIMSEPNFGVPLAFAIMLHNIPEGVSIAIPLYYATHNRWLAFWLCVVVAVAEPLGGVLGYLSLAAFMNDMVVGLMLSSIAGAMTLLSLNEMLPAAHVHPNKSVPTWGLLCGLSVMALSIALLA